MVDEHSDSQHSTEQAQCRYMAAAYPSLSGNDTCTEHRHDASTFELAKAMAGVWQQPEPTDEQVGWFMDDAAAVIDDHDAAPLSRTVTELVWTDEPGLDFTFEVNGVEYVMQENDSGGHVATVPISRTEWNRWIAEADDA